MRKGGQRKGWEKMTRVWGSLVANTVLYSRFSLVTVGSAWTAQIDCESTGLKTAQAGGRFPGPGPRCGLGRGGARAAPTRANFGYWSERKPKKNVGMLLSWATLLGRSACSLLGAALELAAGPCGSCVCASGPRRPRVGTGQYRSYCTVFRFSFSRSYNRCILNNFA